MSWKKLASTILLKHPRLTVVEDDIELPDGHTSKYIYFANANDAAMVIAIKDDSILIQTEYSYPPDQHMYQLPGGAIEEGEDPIPAALRELEEESGYAAGVDSEVSYIGYFYVNNRRSAAKMHIVLVEDPTETGETNFDPEEYIESEWIQLTTLRNMIKEGKIVNYSLLAGLALYDNTRN